MAYLHIGRSVFGMNFTELGNLVLFDQNNATVWQLFDHPTDSLLVGQTLFPFQKLTSSTSSSNLTPVLYSLTVQADNTLVAYVESHLSLPYFRSYSNVEYVKLENESLLGQKIPIASSSSPQFIRLNLDGHLKAYEWGRSNWNTVAHLMTSDIGDCCYPMVCGNYGICSSNGQCSCPEEAIGNSTFRQINHTQPSLGCSLVTPICCDHSQYHTILELKNTNYFYFNSYSSTLEDYKKSCLENCSYIAALFIDNWAYDPRNGCFLLSEVFSLINNEGRDENVTGFLKV
ncbi:hypothetical protein CsSME_00027562 [Camellia sinensis var. sinensis]